MAHATYPCEVLTPEGEVFGGEVEMISTRTTLGSIGILANHTPLLARLEPTELRLYRSETDIARYAQAEGFMQVSDNHALLLVGEIKTIEELDREELEAAREAAQAARDAAVEGSEAAAQAGRELRRSEAFLRIIEGR